MNTLDKNAGAIASIEVLARAVALAFKDDEWAPGITIAHIRAERHFYGSIVRYPNGDGSKEVVQKTRGVTVAQTIRSLGCEWKGDLPKVSPVPAHNAAAIDGAWKTLAVTIDAFKIAFGDSDPRTQALELIGGTP